MMQTEEDNKRIVSVCKDIAKARNIVAIGIYGSRVCGYARKDSDYDVLLVLEDFDEAVRYYYTNVASAQFAVLAVDKKAIEVDAEEGMLGDFVVGRLISPYIPVLTQEYLRAREVETKRRLAREDLEDLIIEYGELARGLVINPEYLVLARMRKRAKAYPPLKYSYVNMLQTGLREKNMASIIDGYLEALRDLENLKILKFDGENIVLENSYIDDVLSFKTMKKVVNILEFNKKALYAYVTHGRAGKVKIDVATKELASKIKRELTVTINKQEIEDPKNYLFLKTEKGLVNLNERNSITEVVRKIRSGRKITVNLLAGALNEVYLVEVEKEKLVVKRFTDWFNFKWFALNIVAYGAKIFTLSGKARLSNEYGTNRLLAENHIPVPEIVYINIQDRLLIEKYVEGKTILDNIKEAITEDNLTDEQRRWALEMGKLIADIHGLDVTLGDCKPENFIIASNGKIYVLDLEQGERRGDKAWDIAEFCYFSGHYGNTLTTGLQQFIKCFTEGYAQRGDKNILRKAAELGYGRVFIAWTPMPIIKGISDILRSA